MRGEFPLRIRVRRVLLAAFLLPVLLSCSPREGLRDFTSDGCSLFPDRSLIDETDWCDCCLDHDIAYWRGGTEEERLVADLALRACVLERTGDEKLAEFMFQGVRLGGSPYFNTWYRWGYGWPFDHKYRALSQAERALAEEKLEAFFRENSADPCR